MKSVKRIGIASAALCALLLAVGWSSSPRAQGSPGSPPGRIARLLEVGSVLTDDGTIWVYRPDQGHWLKIDDAFRDQQRRTHVLPLPVPVSSIREMVTFGFILTDDGDCWLYLVDKDTWEKLPAPH